jgi:cytochrome c
MKFGTGLILALGLSAVGLFVQDGAFAVDASMTTSPAAAKATASTQDTLRARDLLDKAIERYKAVGDQALAEFSRGGNFVDGEEYVYVVSTDGVMLASGGSSSALIGQNVADMNDAAGKPFFREMLLKAREKGAGTVEYQWLNRVDNKVERKVAYFEKVNKAIIAVGYYVARATPAQAQALLDKAVKAIHADRAKALDAFNRTRGEFSEDDLYVFVISLSDKRFLAHGVNHRLVGTDGSDLRDPNGKLIVQQMVDAVATRDQAEVDYSWPNPVTGRVEEKHTLLRKVDGQIVAVGYYTR